MFWIVLIVLSFIGWVVFDAIEDTDEIDYEEIYPFDDDDEEDNYDYDDYDYDDDDLI